MSDRKDSPVPPPPSVADLLALSPEDRVAQVDFGTRLVPVRGEGQPTPTPPSTRRRPPVQPAAVLTAVPAPAVEPAVEPAVDRAVDRAVEPAAETAAEPVAEPAQEPAPEPDRAPAPAAQAPIEEAPVAPGVVARRPRATRSAQKTAAKKPASTKPAPKPAARAAAKPAAKPAARPERATGATPDVALTPPAPDATETAEVPLTMSAIASLEHPLSALDGEQQLTRSVQQVVDHALERLADAETATLRHLAAMEAEAQRRAELLTAQAELDAELIRLTARREAHAIVSAARGQAGQAPLPQHSAESRQLAEISEAVSRFAESVEASIASLRPGAHRP